MISLPLFTNTTYQPPSRSIKIESAPQHEWKCQCSFLLGSDKISQQKNVRFALDNPTGLAELKTGEQMKWLRQVFNFHSSSFSALSLCAIFRYIFLLLSCIPHPKFMYVQPDGLCKSLSRLLLLLLVIASRNMITCDKYLHRLMHIKQLTTWTQNNRIRLPAARSSEQWMRKEGLEILMSELRNENKLCLLASFWG